MLWHMKTTFGRVAVDLADLAATFKEEVQTVQRILNFRNIIMIRPHGAVETAKNRIGQSMWKLPSRMHEAPHKFDCSSLTKYVWGVQGIWLPRRPVQQLEFCRQYGLFIGNSLEDMAKMKPGDLVFVSSTYRAGEVDDSHDGYHVCLHADRDHVVCATKSELGEGIVLIPYSKLYETRKLKAIVRVHPNPDQLFTFQIPEDRDIETVDDLYRIVEQAVELDKQAAKLQQSIHPKK